MNYPESRPRRLRRSRNDRWIGGVCGGIAEYLNMDPTLVRVAVVIIALVTAAVPVIAIYLLMMLLIPEAEPREPGSIGPAPRFGWQQQNPQQHSDPVWGAAGPPWRPNRDPNIDTSAPQPPRQSAEDLFSRAKHPTQPSGPTVNQPPTPPAQSDPGPAGDKGPEPAGDDKPEG
ncbi:PspC domain-containing protein [Microlunatus sp. Gsoil 973]|jgi:phage shock protein PspC (stress-responsive transcriptional regulator)|uniref:PspC domain-containing protein n=1 Tax=Microlunatus sp. Gsoil 973 TaxID=2672569 RepID=UPI001E4AB8B7|nr:PspC domain-containing protein [Microlunatus sp. Gsoil 973]